MNLSSVFRSSTPVGKDGLVHVEREALVDLLNHCIYADAHVGLDESDLFNRIIAKLDWTGSLSYFSYAADSVARARTARHPGEAHDAFLASVRERLARPEARRIARSLCDELLNADGSMNRRERAVRDELRRCLE